MAFGLGPIVGGLISEYIGWNELFIVSSIVFLLLPILIRQIPKEEPKTFQFDLTGASLTVVNAVALLTAVTQCSTTWLLTGLISIAAHTWYLKRKKESFINPELFTMPTYRKLLLVGFSILVLNLGNLFLMPLVLANLFGKTPLAIGLTIAPGAVLSALLMLFVGRWIDKFGSVRFLFLGHVILALVLIVFWSDLSQSPTIILFGYLFFSPALSITLASLNYETTRILPTKLIGSGMGFMQLMQFFGGAFSVAVSGMLLAFQKKNPLVSNYENVYGVLIVVCIISLFTLLLYVIPVRQSESLRSSHLKKQG